MDQILDSKNIILLLTLFANLALGSLIYWRGRKNLNNISYSLVVFSVILWTFGMILYRVAIGTNSVFWCKVLYINATLTSSFFLLFTFIFPSGKLRLKKWQSFLIFAPNIFIVAAVSLPELMIKDVIIRPGQEKLIIFGFWYFLYALYILIYFFAGFWNLFKAYRISSGVAKSQLRYVFLGYFISANIAFSTNLMMPWWGDTRLNWLGQISTLIWVGLTTYAIITHRLMDIKLVMRRSTVYLASVLTVFLPAVGILYLAESFYPDLLIVISLSVLILGVSVFPPIRNFFYRLANKYFFSSLYDSGQVIAGISDKLRSTLDINEVYNVINQTVTNAFHSKSFGVLGYAPKSNEYQVLFNQGFDIGRETRFPGNRELQEKFVNQSKSLVVEELKAVFGLRYKDTLDLLMKFKVAVLTPLNIKDETLGLLVLGPKETGDMYNDEDLSTLEVIGSQAAIAIKNAQLYEETRKFSQTLQQEVDRQTTELKKANVELRKLDQAKSDFISIASHQLRTPLSAIKGFLSMVIEGSYGKVSADVKDKVEKTYESNERLIRLVDDLLDLSHMEGGKMEFNFAKVNFTEMVASVVEELKIQAEKKKLKFEFIRPQEDFFVWADEQKLRQVVINLTDNAIKYTEKGGVEISLGKTDGHIEFSVKDTGLGMTPEELANLFKKFVRGANAPRYHTEGSGVGLYVAKLLIEAHKGRVWAESEGEGKGSTFFVKMPEYREK